jgi:hypothetical protein
LRPSAQTTSTEQSSNVDQARGSACQLQIRLCNLADGEHNDGRICIDKVSEREQFSAMREEGIEFNLRDSLVAGQADFRDPFGFGDLLRKPWSSRTS